MHPQTSARGRRAFAAVGFAAAAIQLASGVMGDLARSDHGHLVADSALIVRLGTDHVALFRWSSLLDLFGFYLLMVPLAVYLRSRFRATHPMTADVGLVAAVIFGGVGATGAAIWVSATPLISEYAHAAPADRPYLAAIFGAMIHAGAALWHFVEGPAGAVWFASVAISARLRWRGFALYSAILAVAIALGSVGTMVAPDATSSAPTTLIFLPIVVWPVWLAIRILSTGEDFDDEGAAQAS
ncbi:MAG TPA: hypothetical protein VMZ22_13130 [Acidimicrobiales bacterium]|nr:hypothetical protein [Acidimicrobiales bacterium]